MKVPDGEPESGVEKSKGLIARIEPFAIHDGPGIRTVIYMKGCPLRCIWCYMPQLQKDIPEILSHVEKCIKCGTCSQLCPTQAIQWNGRGEKEISRDLCDGCGLCTHHCPFMALELTGRYYSLEELSREIEKDTPIFRRSNGGVTISGGEPGLQASFVAEFLRRCKQLQIHTAMETTGLVAWEKLSCLIAHLDLIYFDIKHMDENKHREFTGASNRLILENIRRASRKLPLTLRMPVIPGLNDDAVNISSTAQFAKDLGTSVIHIELIPFHQFGAGFYRRLEKKYLLSDLSPAADEKVMRLKEKVESFGVRCQIGG